MTSTPVTDRLKSDLSPLRNRNYLDPKLFYKLEAGFDRKINMMEPILILFLALWLGQEVIVPPGATSNPGVLITPDVNSIDCNDDGTLHHSLH